MELHGGLTIFVTTSETGPTLYSKKTMGMKRSQNLSKKEKAALRILQYIFNGTDKKFGPACLTKKITFRKNKRQLCEKRVYNKLTQEEAEQLIRIIKKRLTPIVNT